MLVALLVVIGALIYSTGASSPSSDQRALIGDLGNPTSYTIVFGEMIVDNEYKTAIFN